MAFSQTITEDMLEWLLTIGSPTAPTNKYISFHTGDPGTTGASEATQIPRTLHNAWKTGTAGDGSVSNSGSGLSAAATANPSGNITHFAVWDSSSAGVYLFGGSLTSGPHTVTTNDKMSWDDGALVATIT